MQYEQKLSQPLIARTKAWLGSRLSSESWIDSKFSSEFVVCSSLFVEGFRMFSVIAMSFCFSLIDLFIRSVICGICAGPATMSTASWSRSSSPRRCAMQPITATVSWGLESFKCFKCPRCEMTLCSAWSRTEHVLMSTASASFTVSVSEKPASFSAEVTRAVSSLFI